MRTAKIVFHLYLNLLPLETNNLQQIVQERGSKIDFENRFKCIEHLRVQYLEEWTMYRLIERDGRYAFYECRLELQWKDGP